MKRILVMCTGNSCRSQMAHGYFKLFAGNEAEIYSAGLNTHGLNPDAVKVMKEDDVDIAYHTSNLIDEYTDIEFDLVVTVCDHAHEYCPVFPRKTTKVHQNFSDPSKSEETGEDRLNEFRKVRDQIKSFCEELIGDFLFNE